MIFLLYKLNGFSYSQADPQKKSPKYRWMSYCGDVVIKNAVEDVLKLEILFD